MVFMVPQYVMSFEIEGITYKWIINGDDDVDTLSKILRWNGITTYAVRLYDNEKDVGLARLG